MIQMISRLGIFLLRLYDHLCDGCAHVAAWMMLAMAVGINYEVVSRYFFFKPTIWASDTADYILLYTTFFASAWLLKEKGHVYLTFLTDHLSPKSQLIMEVVNSLICAIVCGFLVYYGAAGSWEAFEKKFIVSRPFGVPQFLLLGVIPFGFILLLVQFVRDAFNSIRAFKKLSQEEG
jgi:C4-dicarboxylate transporter, DctQ subunit